MLFNDSFQIAPAQSSSLRSWSSEYPSFSHQPLNLERSEIRLLRVLSGPSDALIQCTLDQFPLSARYHCVSYTWGDTGGEKYIEINRRPFRVRQNLWNFLWQARKNGVKEPLWIDALCINQRDVKERNHQVQQMTAIYKGAARVLAWLGHGSEETEALIASISMLDSDLVSFVWKDRSELYSCVLGASAINLSQASIKEMMRLPYWTRLWIVQEIRFARRATLLYGNSSCDWRNYCRLVRTLSVPKKLDQNQEDNPFKLFAALEVPLQAGWYEFGDILVRLKDFQCLEWRDRVYGVLGMVHGGSDFPVDYSLEPLPFFLRILQHWPELTKVQAYVDNLASLLNIGPGTVDIAKYSTQNLPLTILTERLQSHVRSLNMKLTLWLGDHRAEFLPVNQLVEGPHQDGFRLCGRCLGQVTQWAREASMQPLLTDGQSLNPETPGTDFEDCLIPFVEVTIPNFKDRIFVHRSRHGSDGVRAMELLFHSRIHQLLYRDADSPRVLALDLNQYWMISQNWADRFALIHRCRDAECDFRDDLV
jgi:hypothetical protein